MISGTYVQAENSRLKYKLAGSMHFPGSSGVLSDDDAAEHQGHSNVGPPVSGAAGGSSMLVRFLRCYQ
jgi:hypothetical protein